MPYYAIMISIAVPYKGMIAGVDGKKNKLFFVDCTCRESDFFYIHNPKGLLEMVFKHYRSRENNSMHNFLVYENMMKTHMRDYYFVEPLKMTCIGCGNMVDIVEREYLEMMKQFR